MTTTLEIGSRVPATLVGGELHGTRLFVRVGLNGLPRFLEFPILGGSVWIDHGWPDNEQPAIPPATSIRYVLHDNWPVRYRAEGDDDGDRDLEPEPVLPGVESC